MVIASPDYDNDLKEIKARYGLPGEIFTRESAAGADTLRPWGWSADAVRQFALAGADPSRLPSPDRIDTLRRLSHRRSSIEILRRLGHDDLLPLETADPDEAVRMEREHPGCYLKSPWSCSGRGVLCIGGMTPEVIRSKAAGIIHRQGSVMVERGMKKVLDFAMLFHASGGRVTHRGLSMFLTEQRGMYGGNIVAPQEWMAERIGHDLPFADMERVLTSLVGPHYEGWLGVDMMVCERGIIHPCIELNLRNTMGVAAMHIHERLRPARPMLLSWSLTPAGIPVLPPREGFTLQLTPL